MRNCFSDFEPFLMENLQLVEIRAESLAKEGAARLFFESEFPA